MALVQGLACSPKIAILEEFTKRLDLKETDVRDNHEFISSFVTSIPLPCWIKDANKKILYINSAYEKIYNIAYEDYVGRTDYEVWPKDVADSFTQNDQDVLENGKVYSVEIITSNNKNGKKRDHITVVKFPIRSKGEIIGIAGLVTSYFP